MECKLNNLLAVMIAAVLSAAFIVYVPLAGLRILPALLLGFVFPGYTVMCATLRTEDLNISQKITVTLGISMAVVVVGGFFLNLSLWGLTALGWALWLGGITLAAGLIAILRRLFVRREGTIREKAEPGPTRQVWFAPLLGVSLIMFIAAGYQAVHGTVVQPRPGFTELWFVLDESSDVDAFVGVANNEHQAESYCLEVVTDSFTIYEACPIELANGERWEVEIRLPADVYSRGGTVARLYRSGDMNSVYREAHLQSAFE
jgi:uncharacterized membrane protein